MVCNEMVACAVHGDKARSSSAPAQQSNTATGLGQGAMRVRRAPEALGSSERAS